MTEVTRDDGRFPVRWLKDAPDRDAVKAELRAARPALEKLDIILQQKKLDGMSGCKPDFIDAGWPYRAADLNGYLRALEEIQTLIPKY